MVIVLMNPAKEQVDSLENHVRNVVLKDVNNVLKMNISFMTRKVRFMFAELVQMIDVLKQIKRVQGIVYCVINNMNVDLVNN